jgi:hypothetical protein
MAKAKGSSKTGGRKRGTPNKITRNVREAILAAFEEAGGVDYLRTVAKEDPKTFCTLLGKTMPTVVAGGGTQPHGPRLSDLHQERLRAAPTGAAAR